MSIRPNRCLFSAVNAVTVVTSALVVAAAPAVGAVAVTGGVTNAVTETGTGTVSGTAGTKAKPYVGRLAGATRYDTAAAIAMRRAKSEVPVKEVRIVRGDRPLDALAAVSDETVLLVPASGPIPQSVSKAFAALRTDWVHVIGTERSLPTAQVRKLVGEIAFERIAVDDPSFSSLTRAAAWADYAPDRHPDTIEGMLLASRADVGLAAAATQVRDRRVALAPEKGPWPDVTKQESWTPPTWGGPLVRIGGKAGIPDARMATLNASLPRKEGTKPPVTVDLGSADRPATSVALAKAAFPHGARSVYLANMSGGVDAAAAASLTDGPVLLVPACGALPAPLKTYLSELKAQNVIALGGTGAVCDGILTQAAAATKPRPSRFATDVSSTDVQVDEDTLAALSCVLDKAGAVHCWGDGYRIDARTTQGWRAPRLVPDLTGGVRELAGSTACAVSGKGALLCPEPAHGTLRWAPVRGLTSGVVSGGSGTCVLKDGGVPWCVVPGTAPKGATQVVGVKGAVQVSGTANFGCAVAAKGAKSPVQCWGRWSESLGAAIRDHGATPVAGLPANIVEVDALENTIDDTTQHVLVARTGDNRAYAVYNVGAPPAQRTNYRLPSDAKRLAGDGSGCHITTRGKLACELGGVGIGISGSSVPAIGGAGADQVTAISVGAPPAQSGIALRADGTVLSWNDTENWPRSTLLGDGIVLERKRPASPLGFERRAR